MANIIVKNEKGEIFQNLIGVFQKRFAIAVGNAVHTGQAQSVMYHGNNYTIFPDGRRNNGAPPGGHPGAGQPSKGYDKELKIRYFSDLHEALKEEAEKNNRSLNDEIVARLKESLQ